MSHIPYTICRSGTYYYNRRVPKHAVKAYGLFIRQALSKCPEEAEAYAKRLGDVLEGSWRRTTERVQLVDIPVTQTNIDRSLNMPKNKCRGILLHQRFRFLQYPEKIAIV